MRRALVIAGALAASSAWAHPLGNFTTNRQARVEVGPGALRVRYVVDMAELPTYRTLAEIDLNGDGGADDAEYDTWAHRLAGDVGRNLHVAVDGGGVVLRVTREHAESLPGAGGLPTLRVELEFDAPLAAVRGDVDVHDDNFAGLPGWQEIVAAGSPGVAVETSSAATTDPTDGLRHYPEDALAAPPQTRAARFAFAPGTGSASMQAERGAARSASAIV
jgi:nickel/cobalt exporter